MLWREKREEKIKEEGRRRKYRRIKLEKRRVEEEERGTRREDERGEKDGNRE